MENILALLDKISGISQSSARLSLLDIDLMMDHTRKLYDELMTLRQQEQPTAQEAMPETDKVVASPQPVVAQQQEPVAAPVAEIPASTPEPEIPVIVPATEDPVVAATAAVAEPSAPLAEEAPVAEEKKNLYMEMPAAVTPAETYARKLTHFGVSNRDIRMYIGINDQYNFISELFGNNNEAYEEILDEINTFETQEDALFFLNNSGVTTLYGWEEDHFSVRIFYNVLNQFFSAK